MMLTDTLPVSMESEAHERLNELGLHRILDRMLGRVKEIPNLARIAVTAPYNEVLGPDQQIVIEAYVNGPPSIEAELDFDRWVFENNPGEDGFHFVLLTIHGSFDRKTWKHTNILKCTTNLPRFSQNEAT